MQVFELSRSFKPDALQTCIEKMPGVLFVGFYSKTILNLELISTVSIFCLQEGKV